MPVAPLPISVLAVACLLGAARGQERIPVAYPERDVLSPFRTPTDVYAPPDELFRDLRAMQNIARRSDVAKSFDADGREVVDDKLWRQLRDKVLAKGVDAGYLGQMMRLHRNGEERGVGFYAAFWVTNVDYVLNLISHIPGEPERKIREESLPRAAAFARAHLAKKFGDLSSDEQRTILQGLPQIGSPVAKAQGLTREPQPQDFLHELRLVPFFQLLDRDDVFDQAQALWFLKEVFTVRIDLARAWLEPALPRVHQLLGGDAETVRDEAIALYRVIGPKKLAEPPTDKRELLAWAEQAERELFPPIRNLNDTIVQLHPSAERDAVVAAGVAALTNSSIGDPFSGQFKDGTWYRGFRVARVPDELAPLAIPKGAIITSVNGAPVTNAEELLRAVTQSLRSNARPIQLFVEYVKDEQRHAIEFRIV